MTLVTQFTGDSCIHIPALRGHSFATFRRNRHISRDWLIKLRLVTVSQITILVRLVESLSTQDVALLMRCLCYNSLVN